MTEPHTIEYKPDGKTLDAFLLDDSFFRLCSGPFGSGKSAACAVELFRRVCQEIRHCWQELDELFFSRVQTRVLK